MAVRKMAPKSLGSQAPRLLSAVWPWFAPLFLLVCVVTAAGQQRDGAARLLRPPIPCSKP